MRTAEMHVNGTTHLLTCSAAVVSFIRSRERREGDEFDYLVDILCQMAHAGHMYARLTGLGDYPDLDRDTFLYTVDASEIAAYEQLAADLITGDRTVDAAPPKNGEAAPAAAQQN